MVSNRRHRLNKQKCRNGEIPCYKRLRRSKEKRNQLHVKRMQKSRLLKLQRMRVSKSVDFEMTDNPLIFNNGNEGTHGKSVI